MKVNWKRTTKESGILNVKLRGFEWNKAQDDSYRILSKEISSSDFKRGYAPNKIKDNLISDEQMLVYAIELISQDLLARALLECDIAIIGQPELEVNEVSKSKLDINFICMLRPEVTLGNYLDIDVSDVACNDIDEVIIDRVINGSEVDIPDHLIRMEANQFSKKILELSNFDSLSNYADSLGVEYSVLREQIFNATKELVKERLVLEEIANKEDIKVEEDEIEEEYYELSKENGVSIKDIKKSVDLVLVSHSVLMKKTSDFLVNKNTL